MEKLREEKFERDSKLLRENRFFLAIILD